MKTPDRRITVLAYTMLTIWLLVYAYGCLATSTVTVQPLDVGQSPAVITYTPADLPGRNQWVETANGLQMVGLVSRFVSLETKNASGEKRYRVAAR